MNKPIRELRLVAEASVLAIGLLMSSGANADDDLMADIPSDPLSHSCGKGQFSHT